MMAESADAKPECSHDDENPPGNAFNFVCHATVTCVACTMHILYDAYCISSAYKLCHAGRQAHRNKKKLTLN